MARKFLFFPMSSSTSLPGREAGEADGEELIANQAGIPAEYRGNNLVVFGGWKDDLGRVEYLDWFAGRWMQMRIKRQSIGDRGVEVRVVEG